MEPTSRQHPHFHHPYLPYPRTTGTPTSLPPPIGTHQLPYSRPTWTAVSGSAERDRRREPEDEYSSSGSEGQLDDEDDEARDAPGLSPAPRRPSYSAAYSAYRSPPPPPPSLPSASPRGHPPLGHSRGLELLRQAADAAEARDFHVSSVKSLAQLRRQREAVIQGLRATAREDQAGPALAMVTSARERVKAQTTSRSLASGKAPPKHQYDLYLSTLSRYASFCQDSLGLCAWPIEPLRIALWLSEAFGEEVGRKTMDNYVRCLEFAREESVDLFGPNPEGGLPMGKPFKEHPVLSEILESKGSLQPKLKKKRASPDGGPGVGAGAGAGAGGGYLGLREGTGPGPGTLPRYGYAPTSTPPSAPAAPGGRGPPASAYSPYSHPRW